MTLRDFTPSETSESWLFFGIPQIRRLLPGVSARLAQEMLCLNLRVSSSGAVTFLDFWVFLELVIRATRHTRLG